VYEVRKDDSDWHLLPDESLPIRVWRPHDRRHWEADSSTRAALPIMRRLELLNRRVDAQAQSRLASCGVYWVPSEITFPPNPAFPGSTDPFVSEFMHLGMTAIKTPGSAAAAIPYVGRAPAEYIEKIRYDEFGAQADMELQAKREFEIRRLATAIDVPPEVLLGMVGVNHWGQWQIEESALKTTVTSLLELIVWSLTVGYLTPALSAVRDREVPIDAGTDYDPQRKRIVWYDLSELSVRPDKSQSALALNDSLTITTKSTLRETGFDETDALVDMTELRKRIGLQFIKNPATAEAGLELLGITVSAPINAGTPAPGGEPSASIPSGPGDTTISLPTGAPPDTRDAVPTPLPAPASVNGS